MNRQIALIVLFTLPLAPLLLAQTSSTGAITGTVTDPAGSLVPLAEIKVTNPASGESRTTTSTSNGTYLVGLLPPAVYRVEVSKTDSSLSAIQAFPLT